MYLISDNRAAIREIQIYLTYIANSLPGMPYTSIDGIYSDATKAAVAYFQEFEKIDITGMVDVKTFRILYERYNALIGISEEIKNVINDEIYPLKRGDVNENVRRLNSLTVELSKYFDIPNLSYGDGYDENTVSAVKLLQKTFGLFESGETDTSLEKRIFEELKHRENFEKFYKND